MSAIEKPFADLFIESDKDVDLKFLNESIRNYLNSGFVICLGCILFVKDIPFICREFFGIILILVGFIVMTLNSARVISGIMTYFKSKRRDGDSFARKFYIFLSAAIFSIISFYALNGIVAAQISINVK